MIRRLTSLAALPLLAGCGGHNSTTVTRRSADMRAFWRYQQSLITSMPNRVFDQPYGSFDPRFYPSVPSQTFLSAWLVTGDETYADSARRQLAYARTRENLDHLVLYPDGTKIGRMAQAEQILGYFVAWRTLNDLKYLRWADDALSGLLKLPRSPVVWRGRTFSLYHYLYAPASPYRPDPSIRIDPNQDANLGLVFTLLYHTPESAYYHDGNAAARAREELDAVVAVQASSGALPVTQDSLDEPDTLYGSWALMFLHWANQYWQDESYEAALKRGAMWLDQYSNGNSVHFYPRRVEGPAPIYELWERLPLISRYGTTTGALQEAIDTGTAALVDAKGPSGGWATPVADQILLGVRQDVGRW